MKRRSQRNVLVVGAVALGAYLLWRQNQSGGMPGPSQGQLQTNTPNSSQVGPGSAPVIAIPATPGGM